MAVSPGPQGLCDRVCHSRKREQFKKHVLLGSRHWEAGKAVTPASLGFVLCACSSRHCDFGRNVTG